MTVGLISGGFDTQQPQTEAKTIPCRHTNSRLGAESHDSTSNVHSNDGKDASSRQCEPLSAIASPRVRLEKPAALSGRRSPAILPSGWALLEPWPRTPPISRAAPRHESCACDAAGGSCILTYHPRGSRDLLAALWMMRNPPISSVADLANLPGGFAHLRFPGGRPECRAPYVDRGSARLAPKRQSTRQNLLRGNGCTPQFATIYEHGIQ